MKFVGLEPATAFRDAIDALSMPEKLVVCGSLEDKEYMQEGLADAEESVDMILARALVFEVEPWFDSQRMALNHESEAVDKLVGYWPDGDIAKPGFSLAHDMMTGELHTHVVGAKVGVSQAWQLPAHFHFGGWNECPAPDIQCAIWRYWQAAYGAHIVAISNDVIEAYVERPPQSQAQAMALAWQQYLYCGDIVDQGVESIANLAATLVNHKVWFFWWD